jgi:serum/glucocorticoid-regulated kinase 2
MSGWKLGKSTFYPSRFPRLQLTCSPPEIKEATSSNSKASLGASPAPSSRSTTPTPGNPTPSGLVGRNGLLLINVLAARGLTLPAGVSMPPAVDKALNSQQAQIAASVTSSSVSQRQQASRGHKTRDSMQRKQCWWLPYGKLAISIMTNAFFFC